MIMNISFQLKLFICLFHDLSCKERWRSRLRLIFHTSYSTEYFPAFCRQTSFQFIQKLNNFSSKSTSVIAHLLKYINFDAIFLALLAGGCKCIYASSTVQRYNLPNGSQLCAGHQADNTAKWQQQSA